MITLKLNIIYVTNKYFTHFIQEPALSLDPQTQSLLEIAGFRREVAENCRYLGLNKHRLAIPVHIVHMPFLIYSTAKETWQAAQALPL